ncbi:MAG: PilZ domain-containing protein [Nitrospirales bacterium]|nr:PilZ domain-containing protein [Nitrospirales bacterium]
MKEGKRDKRGHRREPQQETIAFAVVGSFDGRKEFLPESDIKGSIIDMSENGVGILTDTLLEPGMLLKFKNFKESGMGVVMWTLNSGSRYRVGLKFV